MPRLKNVAIRASLVMLAAYVGCIAGRAVRFGPKYFTEFELRELHPFGTVVSIALAAITVPAVTLLVMAIVLSACYLIGWLPLWTWWLLFISYAAISYTVLLEFNRF